MLYLLKVIEVANLNLSKTNEGKISLKFYTQILFLFIPTFDLGNIYRVVLIYLLNQRWKLLNNSV